MKLYEENFRDLFKKILNENLSDSNEINEDENEKNNETDKTDYKKTYVW